jgi:hypothetical protein
MATKERETHKLQCSITEDDLQPHVTFIHRPIAHV